MRTAFIIGFIANLILALAAFLVSPPNVAVHFALGGKPDAWAPSYVNALIMTAVNALIFLSFAFVNYVTRKVPTRWINIPNRDFWMKEENLPEMHSILSSQMFHMGAATFVLLFFVGLLALQANLSEPIQFREDLFWWPFGLFIAYTVYWTIKTLLVFRIPKPVSGK